MIDRPLIVDAHLDLAYNVENGRNVLVHAAQQQADHDGIPSVGLPDLREGGVELICGTIFCEPASELRPGYRTADEARAMMLKQLEWYQKQALAGRIRLVTRRQQIKELLDDLNTSENQQTTRRDVLSAQPMILLLEGADPIRSTDDVAELFALGIRIVGLAWRGTRYAGGTGQPGPLTPEGIKLAHTLDQAGMIHDGSHLAEESFWQLLEQTHGRVMASHSNCRAIVPTDRQLSDAMIRAIAHRDGVIGMNFYDRFLLRPDLMPARRATLGDVVAHIRHISDLLGDTRHIGLGTDMDGGFGQERIPVEIRSAADLAKLADALSDAGYADSDIVGILGGNWLRFFSESLPDHDNAEG